MGSIATIPGRHPAVSATRRIGRHILSDLPVYMVAVLYAVGASVWAGGFDLVFGGGAGSYSDIIGTIAVELLLPTALAGVGIAGLIANPSAPLRQIGLWLSDLDVPRIVSGLLLLFPTAIFLAGFASVKAHLSAGGFQYDVLLANIGWFVFLGHNPIDVLHAALPPPTFAPAIDYIYSTTWFVWISGILIYMAVQNDDQLRQRYFLSLFTTWTLLGNVFAALYVSAGPCFYAGVTGDAARFASPMAALHAAIGSGTGAMAFQDLLWRMHESRQTGMGAGISAFPSIHVAAATLNALFLAERGRLLAWIGWIYAGVILVGSVYLGWHYAVDGVFSIAAVMVIHRVLRRVLAPRRNKT